MNSGSPLNFGAICGAHPAHPLVFIRPELHPVDERPSHRITAIPGEPIRYHFGFYALVGLLERLGVRIDWAVNIPSALGFSALLILLYAVSFQLFANARISWLTVIFFLQRIAFRCAVF